MKCRMLQIVQEKFSSYSLDISTLHSEYKKTNGQDFQAISKCWVKIEKLMQCTCSLSLSLIFPWQHVPSDHCHALTPWFFRPYCKGEDSKTEKLLCNKEEKGYHGYHGTHHHTQSQSQRSWLKKWQQITEPLTEGHYGKQCEDSYPVRYTVHQLVIAHEFLRAHCHKSAL